MVLISTKRRKGQFFMIGAIIVVVSMFTLIDALAIDERFDASDTQEIDLAVRYHKIETILSETIEESNQFNRKRDLERAVEFMKQELASEEIRLDIEYSDPQILPIDATIKMTSPDLQLEKEIELN